MTAVLPARHTVRPPTKDDAKAAFELVAAANTAVIGFADYTLDDMVDELTDPGFAAETDGWLVFDGDRLAGYGSVFGKGDHHQLAIDVIAPDPAVVTHLLGEVIRRSREIAQAYGHASVLLDIGVYRADETRRAWLAEHGFRSGTTYHRMRIDHHGPVDPPVVPAGITVRRGAPDEASRRAAQAVLNGSFDRQFGFSPRPYEEWHASHENQSTFDWSQITLLELDGRAVGFRECTDQYIEDENCNYIGRLGVLAEARGKGLATYLLRDQFALDAAAGRTGTILHVDTNNPTPALDLYLSVGMRAVLVIDVWRLNLAID